MQKIYRTIAILLLCGALCTPCAEARAHSGVRAIITDSLSGLRNPGITTSLSGLRRATTTALTDRSTGPSRGRPTTTIM